MMNVCDTRIAALLDRAGQTMSDLPINYDTASILSLSNEAWKYIQDNNLEHRSAGYDRAVYACHLADIIDRLELALYNVVEQRDALLKELPECDGYVCATCEHIVEKGDCDECKSCDDHCSWWEWRGVQDW